MILLSDSATEIATVRSILLEKDVVRDSETMDILISTVSDTLLISKEDTSTKLDAIAHLVCIAEKFPWSFINLQKQLNKKSTVSQSKTIGSATKNQRLRK